MIEFDKNVFINCPFDDDFTYNLLLPLVFTVQYLGYKPQLSLLKADSAQTRIDKIVELINTSRFGIHDLSRLVSKEVNEHFRMNMPFELGIDYGCKRLKDGKWINKKILILEEKRYRFQQSLSDLSGSDIKAHNNEPEKIIECVRDWFVTEDDLIKVKAPIQIWYLYNDYHAEMNDYFEKELGYTSKTKIPIADQIKFMDRWIRKFLNKL